MTFEANGTENSIARLLEEIVSPSAQDISEEEIYEVLRSASRFIADESGRDIPPRYHNVMLLALIYEGKFRSVRLTPKTKSVLREGQSSRFVEMVANRGYRLMVESYLGTFATTENVGVVVGEVAIDINFITRSTSVKPPQWVHDAVYAGIGHQKGLGLSDRSKAARAYHKLTGGSPEDPEVAQELYRSMVNYNDFASSLRRVGVTHKAIGGPLGRYSGKLTERGIERYVENLILE
jgi:hypothetical protein